MLCLSGFVEQLMSSWLPYKHYAKYYYLKWKYGQDSPWMQPFFNFFMMDVLMKCFRLGSRDIHLLGTFASDDWAYILTL